MRKVFLLSFIFFCFCITLKNSIAENTTNVFVDDKEETLNEATINNNVNEILKQVVVDHVDHASHKEHLNTRNNGVESHIFFRRDPNDMIYADVYHVFADDRLLHKEYRYNNNKVISNYIGEKSFKDIDGKKGYTVGTYFNLHDKPIIGTFPNKERASLPFQVTRPQSTIFRLRPTKKITQYTLDNFKAPDLNSSKSDIAAEARKIEWEKTHSYPKSKMDILKEDQKKADETKSTSKRKLEQPKKPEQASWVKGFKKWFNGFFGTNKTIVKEDILGCVEEHYTPRDKEFAKKYHEELLGVVKKGKTEVGKVIERYQSMENKQTQKLSPLKDKAWEKCFLPIETKKTSS